MNLNTARGYLWPDQGWVIAVQVAAASDLAKAGGTFRHKTSSGLDYLWHAVDDALYNFDGTTALVTGLTAKFAPAHYAFGSPAGQSGYLNGTNTQAQAIRLNGVTFESVVHDILQPTTASSFATSGGSIPDGTYLAKVCWIDDDADVPVYSAPSATETIVVSGGGGAATMTVNEPASAAGRVTKFRISFTAAGATDTPSNYLYYTDFAKAAGNQTFTSLPAVSTDQAFVDVNGTYRQAHLPLTGVNSCVIHEGRLFVAATTSNKVYFSERNNPNHWYTTNEATAGAETGWNSPVQGLASANGQVYVFTSDSIHTISGDFTRDDQGTNKTFLLRMDTDGIDQNFGGVNHASIGNIGPALYFWSTRGPAVINGGRASLLLDDDIQDFVVYTLDKTYLNRIVFTEDPNTHAACWLVPRRVNTSRPMDGASTAGICDRIVRFDPMHNRWMAPLWPGECVHINTRRNGVDGTDTQELFLMGMGANMGTVKKFNIGHTSGGAADSSGALYDGLLATTEGSTTTAIVTLAGITADQLIGKGLLVKYASADTGFPDAVAYKEITDNTATAGASVTLTWAGALTASTSTLRTYRVAGWDTPVDIRFDLREYLQDLPPEKSVQLREVELRLRDVVGTEASA
jgi:hypothetical protein